MNTLLIQMTIPR